MTAPAAECPGCTAVSKAARLNHIGGWFHHQNELDLLQLRVSRKQRREGALASWQFLAAEEKEAQIERRGAPVNADSR